jgi:hypothetical protein
MTDTQILSLIQAAYPGLTKETRETIGDVAIAAQISVGLTKQVTTRIGIGNVLQALDPVDGAVVLGAMESAASANTSPLYWGLMLLNKGILDISLSATQAQLAALVTDGLMTSTQAAAIIALCTVPDSISYNRVSNVLNANGY